MAIPLVASAQTIKVGQLYYSINSNGTVSVVPGPNKYSGSIIVPDSVSYNGKNYPVASLASKAFDGNDQVTSISLPNTITSIGSWCFSGTKIKSIKLPSNLNSLSTGTFSNCSSLENILVGDNLEYISGTMVFFACTKLKEIKLPGIISISSEGVFEHCHSLVSVLFGENLRTIHSGAFIDCKKLADVYCYAKIAPSVSASAFESTGNITLHVPEEAIESYSNELPWSEFKNIVSISSDSETQKCDLPVITYSNGKLSFSCNTLDAEIVTSISNSDVKTHIGNEIDINATYIISSYATKIGYLNSDVASATLCWIDQQPQTEGISNGVANIPANAVLIKNNDGILNIQGLDEGTQVIVYAIDGKQAGSATSLQGEANINTTLRSGNIAVVKMGEKSIKVVMK